MWRSKQNLGRGLGSDPGPRGQDVSSHALVLNSSMNYFSLKAELAAKIIYKSDRTDCQWHADLISNNGTFPESKQGQNQHSGVLWSNEKLCERAAEYESKSHCERNTSDGFLQVGQQNVTSQLWNLDFHEKSLLKLHENGCMKWTLEYLLPGRGSLLIATNDQTLYHPMLSFSAKW